MNSVMGFLLRPVVWIGERPSIETLADLRMLRRTVLECDLECGLKARVTLDGEFLFDFSAFRPGSDGDTHTLLRHRMVVLNAFLAGLYTEHRRQQKLTPDLMIVDMRELITAETFDAGLSVLGNDPVAHLLYVNDPSTYVPHEPPNDRRLWRSTIYDETVVCAALNRLSALLQADLSRAEAADMLLRACVAHMSYAMHASLVQSWAVTERVLSSEWERVEQTLSRPLSQDPRLAGLENRVCRELERPHPAIAHVVDALRHLDVLSRDLHGRLRAPRVARNKWVHELRPVAVVNAAGSLRVSQDVLRAHFGLDLSIVPDVMVLPAG